MKIIRTIWFSGMYGFCGIVLGETEIEGERRAYLGVHPGRDEGADTRMIAEGGARIQPAVAKEISDFLNST